MLEKIETMSELEQYSSAVKYYATNHEDYLFHNEGNDHALIILTNLFDNANNHIRIAANRLYNDEVVNTPEYIGSMREFLNKKDSKLSIIISKKPSVEEVRTRGRENTFYWMLYNHPAYYQGRVEIKEGEGKSFIGGNNIPVNFCTGDTQMYRFENDIEGRRATANFGDSETTQQLIDVFDKTFESLQSKVELNEYYTN